MKLNRTACVKFESLDLVLDFNVNKFINIDYYYDDAIEREEI